MYMALYRPCTQIAMTFSMMMHFNPLKPTQPPHHNRFTALFLGPPGWAGARRELLDFIVQGEIYRGRHTDHPAGCHSIRTNQCPSPPSPHIFYGLDALPAAQPTVSKHWRHTSPHKIKNFISLPPRWQTAYARTRPLSIYSKWLSRTDTMRMPMGCILAQYGKYEWTVHVLRRCGLLSNYFGYLLLLLLGCIAVLCA